MPWRVIANSPNLDSGFSALRRVGIGLFGIGLLTLGSGVVAWHALKLRSTNLYGNPSVVTKPQLGINVSGSNYFGSERTFANLAFASGHWRDPSAGWNDMDASKLDAAGYPKSSGVLFLVVPPGVQAGNDTPIKCTWSGTATARVDGDRMGEVLGAQSLTVTWKGKSGPTASPSLYLDFSNISASDPLRNLDCRETSLVTSNQFDPALVDSLRPFTVLRFLDWTTTNGNPPSVTWATRTTPDRLTQDGVDGMAIEQMVDLANAVGSDPWFTVPWNADDDYIRRMGELVRDRLGQNHRAYFELSNEVWNFGFNVASQALNEGLAQNLAADRYTNHLYRYAQKSTAMHKILTDVFKDNPARLVRVVSSQNANPWVAERIMEFGDTANWVDALATAPYFGHNFFDGANANVTDLPTLFASLEQMRIDTLKQAADNKAVATRYGKRFITYEGGQHIITSNLDLAAQMQRSPLMYEIYKRFLTDWYAQIGDTMVLYSATSQIGQFGSWGIREYSGQPLAETPKRRAALEFGR